MNRWIFILQATAVLSGAGVLGFKPACRSYSLVRTRGKGISELSHRRGIATWSNDQNVGWAEKQDFNMVAGVM